MKKFSLKALGAILLSLGLVLAGVAVPAYASSPVTSPSVSSTGAVAGLTNPNPITISMTTTTAGQSFSAQVLFPTGWSWVTPNANSCSFWTGNSAWVTSVSGFTPTLNCATNTTQTYPNTGRLFLNNASQSAVALAAGVQVQIVIPANTVNVGQGTDFTLSFRDGSGGGPIDQSIVALSAAPAPAPTPAPVPGPTPETLANTGFDEVPFIASGVALMILGAVVMLVARRKSA